MSISITPLVTEHFLYVRCFGSYEFQSMCDAYAQSFEAAANAGRRALVLDATGLGGEPPGILERYKLGVAIAEAQRRIGPGIMVAGVGDPGMVSRSRFGELVARNRSAYARVFTDLNRAIDWVKNELGIRNGAPVAANPG